MSPFGLEGQKTDVIKLANGDTVTGEIKSLSRGKLEYSTDDAGTVQVEWDKIVRIYSRKFFEVETSAGARYFGTLPEAATDGRMVVFLTSQDTLVMQQVVLMTPIKATFWERTRGNIDFGFNLTRANKQTEWTLGFAFKYRGTKWEFDLSASSYLRFQDPVENNTSRNSLGFSLQRFLRPKNAAVGLFQAQQNRELNLQLRTYVGGGFNRRIVRTNHLAFDAGLGLIGMREKYTTADSATFSAEAALSSKFEAFRFDTPKLDLMVQPQGFASVTKFGRFRANVKARLRYEVLKDFFIGLEGFYTGDSEPPAVDTPKDDYGLTLTFGWSWS